MRKLFWCCSAAGGLAIGGLFSTAYLACRYPDSIVGRGLSAAASTSIVMQPVTGFATMVAKIAHQTANPQETACTPGSTEECVPDDPQPIEAEPAKNGVLEFSAAEAKGDPAPIVINEDDPMPRVNEVEALPSTIELAGAPKEQAGNACPMFMPYCTDEDEPAAKPKMPYAEGEHKKQAGDSEESDDSAIKAWMKLLGAEGQESKSPPTEEELPAPTEEPQAEPKCQEDSHLHEHYSGCPHTTCPYTGKSYPSCAPSRKSGQEEVSEEPPAPPTHHHKKTHKGKEKTPSPAGVDTMEYRPSDGGLNEYGSGPL
jgi:hypothetical protein